MGAKLNIFRVITMISIIKKKKKTHKTDYFIVYCLKYCKLGKLYLPEMFVYMLVTFVSIVCLDNVNNRLGKQLKPGGMFVN